MGRIKTVLIKRIAKSLLREYSNEFTADFTHNKTIVSKYTDIKSPKLRNVVAGYTTRLHRQLTSDEHSKPRLLKGEDLSKFY